MLDIDPLPLVFVAARTQRGNRRRRNQDAFLLAYRHGLYAVADGMGGKPAGHVASQLAVRALEDYFDQTWGVDGETLRQGIEEASTVVRQRGLRDPSCWGMATTMAAIHFDGASLSIAHVGDSRVYRHRGDALERLTSDHTLLEACQRQNAELAARLARSPYRHRLTRAVGAHDDVEVEHRIERVQAGDLFVLCTDGLTRSVPDSQIAAAIAAESGIGSVESISDRLMAAACAAGAEDDVTILIAHVREATPKRLVELAAARVH